MLKVFEGPAEKISMGVFIGASTKIIERKNLNRGISWNAETS